MELSMPGMMPTLMMGSSFWLGEIFGSHFGIDDSGRWLGCPLMDDRDHSGMNILCVWHRAAGILGPVFSLHFYVVHSGVLGRFWAATRERERAKAPSTADHEHTSTRIFGSSKGMKY